MNAARRVLPCICVYLRNPYSGFHFLAVYLRVFACISFLHVCSADYCVFALSGRVFACICVFLRVFSCLLRVFACICVYLRVFSCLLRVFACICMNFVERSEACITVYICVYLRNPYSGFHFLAVYLRVFACISFLRMKVRVKRPATPVRFFNKTQPSTCKLSS